MTRNAKKRAAPSGKSATSNADNEKPTGCRCAAQVQIPGFPPPPERGEGPLSDYLEARPGWHDANRAAAALLITDREGRNQAEHSGGKIIFGSGRGQGWKHIKHADAWEVRQCAAELRQRAASHFRRADEVENAWRESGGVL
jgi:hypothetical protein